MHISPDYRPGHLSTCSYTTAFVFRILMRVSVSIMAVVPSGLIVRIPRHVNVRSSLFYGAKQVRWSTKQCFSTLLVDRHVRLYRSSTPLQDQEGPCSPLLRRAPLVPNSSCRTSIQYRTLGRPLQVIVPRKPLQCRLIQGLYPLVHVT